jgi:hypothetical protein
MLAVEVPVPAMKTPASKVPSPSRMLMTIE